MPAFRDNVGEQAAEIIGSSNGTETELFTNRQPQQQQAGRQHDGWPAEFIKLLPEAGRSDFPTIPPLRQRHQGVAHRTASPDFCSTAYRPTAARFRFPSSWPPESAAHRLRYRLASVAITFRYSPRQQGLVTRDCLRLRGRRA